MERELRQAQDELRKGREEVARALAYKKQMEDEMADLQGTLFEEAHEMVRSEKEARHKDNVRLRETEERVLLLTEELKALKALVADHVVKGDSDTDRRDAGTASPPTSPGDVSARAL
jgi:Rab-3A-interacting protein